MDNYFVNGLKKGYQTGTGGNGITGLLENPLFNIGMGLFASNHSGGNPYEAVLGALQQSRQAKTAGEKRRKEKTLEDKLKELAEVNQSQQAVAQAAQGMPLNAMPQASTLPQVPSPFDPAPQPPALPQVTQTPPLTPMAAQPSGIQSSDIASTLLQYGSPEDRRAVMANLSAKERFKTELDHENSRLDARMDSGFDPVHSTQILEDGRIMQTLKSGRTKISTIGDQEVRAKNPYQFITGRAGEVFAGDRRGGTLNEIIDNSDAADRQATVETTVQNRKLDAKSTLMAQKALPRITKSTDEAIGLIDKIRNHPGLGAGTGLTASIPSLRGSARDFDALMQQAQGKVFLEAYESLKGGGTITEVEGLKAEQAVARLNRAQTKDAFLEALADLELSLMASRVIAQKSAGQNSAPSGTVNPAISTSDDQLINRWLNP